MPVEYALYPNTLTDNPNEYRAIIRNQTTRGTEDIIDYIVSWGSTVTRAEALAMIEEYEAAIVKFVAEGDRVNTDLMHVSSSISGNFNGTDDQFDAHRHQVNLNLNAGPRLQEATEDISPCKVTAGQRRPYITRVEDHSSGTENSRLTPGGLAEIHGRLLKYDPVDEEQGIFFITPNGTEFKAGSPIRNKPSNLIFGIPADLPPGKYRLEVRSIVRRTSGIRRGRSADPLTVNKSTSSV